MKTVLKSGKLALALLAGAALGATLLGQTKSAEKPKAPAAKAKSAPAAAARTAGGIHVPVEYHKLDNGLKVVLSPDHTSPKAVVAVYYGIGFRIEPRDRTGFAHLFEHMM